MLGRRIDCEAGPDLMAGHRGDVDDMPSFLLLHIRQRRGDAVQHALDVYVDRPVPFIDPEALEWRLRHQPGVVDHDVDTPVCLHGGVDQSLNLVALGDVCRYGECLAATAGQLVGQGLDAIGAPRTQHNACALRGEKPGGRLAQPAARARDDDDFSCDVLAHEAATPFYRCHQRTHFFAPALRGTAPRTDVAGTPCQMIGDVAVRCALARCQWLEPAV